MPQQEEKSLNYDEIARIINTLAEPLKKLKRAMLGQQIEDDKGLIDHNDSRQKTRFTETQIQANTYRRLVASIHPKLFALYKEVVDHKEAYAISLDGEGRREEILLRQTKVTPNIQAIALPSISTQTQQPQQKSHWWQRNKSQETMEQQKA